MPSTSKKTHDEILRRYRDCPIECPIVASFEIANLSDFFAVFSSLLDAEKVFWFRGHSKKSYTLSPSALRPADLGKRNRALSLVSEMRRFLEMKLPRPPQHDDILGWIQVAQHYGLPTRLLDWTQNAAVALFFACHKNLDDDGLVAILNPLELNQGINAKISRVLNAQADAMIIAPYLSLDGRMNARGSRTIAINPTWNTERIAMQHGAFTLHGSKHFCLCKNQAHSLVYVPILKEHKPSLLNELQRVGIGEMFIFPEPEHICADLLKMAKLQG